MSILVGVFLYLSPVITNDLPLQVLAVELQFEALLANYYQVLWATGKTPSLHALKTLDTLIICYGCIFHLSMHHMEDIKHFLPQGHDDMLKTVKSPENIQVLKSFLCFETFDDFDVATRIFGKKVMKKQGQKARACVVSVFVGLWQHFMRRSTASIQEQVRRAKDIFGQEDIFQNLKDRDWKEVATFFDRIMIMMRLMKRPAPLVMKQAAALFIGLKSSLAGGTTSKRLVRLRHVAEYVFSNEFTSEANMVSNVAAKSQATGDTVFVKTECTPPSASTLSFMQYIRANVAVGPPEVNHQMLDEVFSGKALLDLNKGEEWEMDALLELSTTLEAAPGFIWREVQLKPSNLSADDLAGEDFMSFLFDQEALDLLGATTAQFPEGVTRDYQCEGGGGIMEESSTMPIILHHSAAPQSLLEQLLVVTGEGCGVILVQQEGEDYYEELGI
ncbi:hypothetical protein EON65_54615 [archaeon]|nr:MAG: hypothetical protein EON65_54615 [archaeon]